MFASRDSRGGAAGVVDIAFTDRYGGVSPPPYDSLDLSRSRPHREEELAANADLVARAFGVEALEGMRQVHGADVQVVTGPSSDPPDCDALVTSTPGMALCVRVGDCVPVVLADPDRGVVGVAHAGRHGVVMGVVPAVVATMHGQGAEAIVAWVGPHVCGGCYEVPGSMRAEVAAVVPAGFACTTWGTPSVDLGAAVTAQLVDGGCEVLPAVACTRESPAFYSYRRDGTASGRTAGLVVLRTPADG